MSLPTLDANFGIKGTQLYDSSTAFDLKFLRTNLRQPVQEFQIGGTAAIDAPQGDPYGPPPFRSGFPRLGQKFQELASVLR